MGSFGGAFDLKKAGFIDPILVSATDGVGTKLKVAIETGVLNTVGIDLVAMCVNDLICEGAKPLFFLDYFATSKLKISNSVKIIDGIIEGCKQEGDLFIPNSKIADIVLDHQIPLEICISSNVKSGASEVSIENHPAIALLKSGFKVTLNTDNRLMANTTLSKEFKKAKEFLKLESLMIFFIQLQAT